MSIQTVHLLNLYCVCCKISSHSSNEYLMSTTNLASM